MSHDILYALAEKWEKSARRVFYDAEQQGDDTFNRPTGKRLLEYGALIYVNCARELKEALSSLSPSSLAIPAKGQKKRRHRA